MNSLGRAVIFLGLAGVATFTLWYTITPKFEARTPTTTIATIVKSARPLSDFSLEATTGKEFTSQSLRGHWTLLFFGYIACPDICPATLSTVRDVWSTFPDQQLPARFVFVNLSPAPVDLQKLRTFVTGFNPTFVGLSGSTEEIAKLNDQLGVYYREQMQRIDHTAALMLIDPQGRLRAVFNPPFTSAGIAADLKLLTKA